MPVVGRVGILSISSESGYEVFGVDGMKKNAATLRRGIQVSIR
jgi:hypothetical protein